MVSEDWTLTTPHLSSFNQNYFLNVFSRFFLHADDSDDRYVLVTEQKSWFEAQSYCRQHHTDLASVRSAAENQELRSRMQANRTVPEAWIGLRRESWKWSDGSSSLFRQWSGYQPDNENNSQACVTMQKGKWDDWSCDAEFNVLCQSKPNTLIHVPS